MSLKRYLMLGVLSFLLALALNAPAATLYTWLWAKDRPLQLVGLSGSLHQGRMSAMLLNGQPLLTDLSWSFHPLWLLAARLDFHVEGGDEGLASGDIGLIPGRRVSVRRGQLSSGIKPLLAAAGYPLPWVDGQATLDLRRLKVKDGVPTDAEGKALLHGVTWGMGQPATLGDFAAEIARDGDALVVKLTSVSGPLELNGEARLLADSSYEIKIQFKPRPDAPPAVQNLLRSTGNPDLQGFYHFDRRGTLATPPAA